MRVFHNSRARLVAAGALLSGVAMAVVFGLIYWTTNQIIETETRNVVNTEIEGLADSYGNLGLLGLAGAIDRRIDNSDEPDAVYLLTDARGRVIAGNLGAWPQAVKPGSGWVELELIRTDNGRSVPLAAASIRLRGGEWLLVGRDASARRDFNRVLVRSLVIALAVALALSLINSWLLTRLVFSRISDISDTATEIVSGDLTRRIPLRDSGDEFDRLAMTLNDMLDRIEELVANLRMTTDSFAHDLRSPLTRLRSHVEALTGTDLDGAGREIASERSLEEVDHLLRVFSDLTEIARAEARLGRSEFSLVDIAALAGSVGEFYEPVGADRGIGIVVKGSAKPVQGHKVLLSRALSNLLDNAMRYAPDNSDITVEIAEESGSVTLSVSDQGPGVPVSEQSEILKPFVTLDPSRAGGASGLGLALVASISRLHEGRLTLADNRPGLKVSMVLPR